MKCVWGGEKNKVSTEYAMSVRENTMLAFCVAPFKLTFVNLYKERAQEYPITFVHRTTFSEFELETLTHTCTRAQQLPLPATTCA